MILDLKTGVSAPWHAAQVAAYDHLDTFDDDRLTFDEESHTYRWDGEIVPSVTQILFNAGLISEFSTWSQYARDLGTAVHYECARYPNIAWSSMDERCIPYVVSLFEWIELTGFEIEQQERRGYNSKYGYAGTYDLSGKLPRYPYRKGTLYLQRDASPARIQVYRHVDDWLKFLKAREKWQTSNRNSTL